MGLRFNGLAGAVLLGTMLLGTMLLGPSLRADEPAEPLRMRILVYNIHHGRGMDDQVDLPRIAAVIRSVDPDLVSLQEVDDRTQRTGGVDQTAVLAELTGLVGQFAHQIDFEGGRYGQAILSRQTGSPISLHWLPGTPDRERRLAGRVDFRFGDRTVTFVTTHLHHANEAFRIAQAEELNRLFATEPSSGEPVGNSLAILTGDLNAPPDSEPLRVLQTRWKSATAEQADQLTFPADQPNRQLDYVLFRSTGAGSVTVKSARVLDEPLASDHRPLLVELEWSGAIH